MMTKKTVYRICKDSFRVKEWMHISWELEHVDNLETLTRAINTHSFGAETIGEYTSIEAAVAELARHKCEARIIKECGRYVVDCDVFTMNEIWQYYDECGALEDEDWNGSSMALWESDPFREK